MITAEELRKIKFTKYLTTPPTNENHSKARLTLENHMISLQFVDFFLNANQPYQDVLLKESLDSENTNQCLDYMVQEATILGYVAEKLEDQPGIRIFNPITE